MPITATRSTLGAISLSSSSDFPVWAYSNDVNPVAFPPWRARLGLRNRLQRGRPDTKTIGIVCVAGCSGPMIVLP